MKSSHDYELVVRDTATVAVAQAATDSSIAVVKSNHSKDSKK